MAMLPATGSDLELVRFTFATQPGYTHRLDIGRGVVSGMTDKREALYQAIYLILHVERYAYPIYSWRYGVEFADLIGKSRDYAMSEIKRRITEALLQDDRITDVGDWSFETGRRHVLAFFTVYTIYGDMPFVREVEL